MRTPSPQLPEPSPEPPGQSLLPPFPAPPAPAPPVPTVPGPLRPLPDAVALPSRLPLPAAGPAFDDQAGLDLPSPRMALQAAAPPAPPPDSASPPPRSPPDRPTSADRPAPPDGPNTREWATRFAQALAEALAGSRPSRQIAPWTTEQARRRIRQLGPALQAGPRPVVRRVLTSAPRRDVVEMTVIIAVGPRTRAIAVRLERAGVNPARPGRGQAWICTVIEAA